MGFVANFIPFPAVQKLWKSVKIWQSYRQLKGGNFFWGMVYIQELMQLCWYVLTAYPLTAAMIGLVNVLTRAHCDNKPPIYASLNCSSSISFMSAPAAYHIKYVTSMFIKTLLDKTKKRIFMSVLYSIIIIIIIIIKKAKFNMPQSKSCKDTIRETKPK